MLLIYQSCGRLVKSQSTGFDFCGFSPYRGVTKFHKVNWVKLDKQRQLTYKFGYSNILANSNLTNFNISKHCVDITNAITE